MNEQNVISLKELSQEQLLKHTLRCASDEKKAQLALIECLREVNRRSLFLQMGYSSLWEFATRYLKLSEGAAQRRIATVRLTNDVPEAKAALESGELSLSVASRIQSFLQNEKKTGTHRTTKDKGALINDLLKPSASGESPSGTVANSAQTQIASQEPSQASTDSISVHVSESPQAVGTDLQMSAGISQRECDLKLSALAPHVPVASEKVRPLGNGMTELKIILDETTMKQLEELKGLITHRLSQATYSEVVATMVGDSLKKAKQKVAGKTSKNSTEKTPTANATPTSAQPIQEFSAPVHNKTQQKCTISAAVKPVVTTADPRDIGVPSSMIREPIPAQVRQAVWRRAGGRCEFVATAGPRAGQRCFGTFRLEIDHKRSVASGGTNDLSNCQMLCSSHHAYKTQNEFPKFKLKTSSL